MRKRFTVEDYMFIDSMAQEAVEKGDTNKLNKLQLLRRKVSSNLVADGKYDELQEAKDKEVMSRV